MWYLRLLGELSIETDGETRRRFRAHKYGLLLAYLAMPPVRAHTRDELIERFWPDAEVEAGRTCLRTALASLRRQFAPSGDSSLSPPDLFLAGGRNTVRVDTRILTTDVERFERLLQRAARATNTGTEVGLLQEAIEIYGGPFLPDAWDDWALRKREELEALYARAVERRASLTVHCSTRAPASITSPSLPSPVRPDDHKAAFPVLLRLPVTPSRFWGRQSDLARLEEMLLDRPDIPVRLLTLTGTGGIGKTRLSIEALRRLSPRYSGAVCFVSLADCTDAAQIPARIADALQIPSGGDSTSLEAISGQLADIGPSLLALDNLEQLVDSGAGAVVRRLLAHCSSLTLLVTSRQPLQIEGEQEFPLQGLPTEEALHLFTDRARASRPDFAVTPRNAVMLGTLCERLDGLPLALELCAAWAHILTPLEMQERLTRRFDLLVSRRRDALPRHRSLHATLEWGCPTEPELRRFFADLSVFRGGWTLEAATTITGESAALEMLATLRERSLLISEETDDGMMRYRYLETIRDFADELMTVDERRAIRQAHCDYFLRLARAAGTLLLTDRPQGFALLDREDANIRAALDFSLDDTPERAFIGYVLAYDLSWPWWVRGRESARDRYDERIFARVDDFSGDARARVLGAGADLTRSRRDLPAAESLYRQAALLLEASGNRFDLAKTLEQLGQTIFDQGRHAEGRALIVEAAGIHEARGDKQTTLWVLARLLGTYTSLGEMDAWWETVGRCRALAEEIGDTSSIAIYDRDCATELSRLGRYAEAEALLRGVVPLFRRLGETYNVADALFRLGEALTGQGKREEAVPLLQESLALFQQIGSQMTLDRLSAFLVEHYPSLLPAP